jgi:hypothetical protein
MATKKQIINFFKELKENNQIRSLEESSLKQAVVLKLLSLFGWDIFNVQEVQPDYASDGLTASFALRAGPEVNILLEVKRGREHPADLHKNLISLASRKRIALCGFTDGIRWWFYLPSVEGTWSQKRCHYVDLLQQKPKDAAPDFIAFLSRDAVASGQFLEAARRAYQEQKLKMAAAALPRAWNRLVSEPDKILVDMLADAVEALCGCRAELAIVAEFIGRHQESWRLPEPPAAPPPAAPPPAASKNASAAPEAKGSAASAGIDFLTRKPESFADKAISSFTLQGCTVPVRSWEEMLMALCHHLAAAHPKEFEKVLWMYDDHQHIFSSYPDQLKFPEKIKRTTIYVETRLTPEKIVKTAGDLMKEFGYGREELVITTQ